MPRLSLVTLKFTAAGSCIRPPAFSKVSFRAVPRGLRKKGYNPPSRHATSESAVLQLADGYAFTCTVPLLVALRLRPAPASTANHSATSSTSTIARVSTLAHSSNFFENADKPTPSSHSSITRASPSGPKPDWQFSDTLAL
ncbi:hypothetical protein EDB85DRAFT_1896584 [Lactarius pseudohatsudake]|nr:hypothetical protein EDB85DRAFT_1896584 [Lactarius pseudohatsudake]